ncbi:hypothetical protein VN0739_15480 [Helicobacter pylori]|nr:hypothetical protein VN1184_14250 [Helicobacter pylori]GHQ33132.1 hypothetical protein VN0348_14670 [Helicobacter pylori]
MLEHFHRKENEKKLKSVFLKTKLKKLFVKGFHAFMNNPILIKTHKRIGGISQHSLKKRGLKRIFNKQTHN